MTYITIARTRNSKALYATASRLCEGTEGAVAFRRGAKSMAKVVDDARRKGHKNVLLVCRKGKKITQRALLITERSYRWVGSS